MHLKEMEEWHRGGLRREIYFLVAGGVDPWKELSVVRRRAEGGEGARTVFIQDAAHCADMMSRRATDRRSLAEARQVRVQCYRVICRTDTGMMKHSFPPLRRSRNMWSAG